MDSSSSSTSTADPRPISSSCTTASLFPRLSRAHAGRRSARRGLAAAAAKAPASSSPSCWFSSITSSPPPASPSAARTSFPPLLAVWSANILFAALGFFLLWQMANGGASRTPSPPGRALTKLEARWQPTTAPPHQLVIKRIASRRPLRIRRAPASSFPASSTNTSCASSSHVPSSSSGFVLLMLVFTFFDLIGDIIRNHISLIIVGDYLFNLIPTCSTSHPALPCSSPS